MKNFTRRQFTVVGFTLAAVIFIAVGAWMIQRSGPLPEVLEPLRSLISYSPFDGETKPVRPVIGVMIENEISARPFHAGLSAADIVYESPTEGNITRFMAVFLPQNPYIGKLGPVRSARSYFIDWIHEYGGVYVHVGGSDEAMRRLYREEGIYNLDQFFFEKEDYFWRENVGKTALEHTMFTNGEMLQKLIEEKGFPPIWEPEKIRSRFDFEKFPEAAKISIDFGYPSYRIQFDYDPQAEWYLRSQAGKAHLNAIGSESQLIAARTVVVQRVSASHINDKAGHISMETVGSGEATVFHEGRAVAARWEKKSLKEKTRFFEKESGDEILLTDGPVWIEVVPLYNKVAW